jgi:hypothetical protein
MMLMIGGGGAAATITQASSIHFPPSDPSNVIFCEVQQGTKIFKWQWMVSNF